MISRFPRISSALKVLIALHDLLAHLLSWKLVSKSHNDDPRRSISSFDEGD